MSKRSAGTVETDGHRTVSRVAAILSFVVAKDGTARLTDIAESLSAPRSSVHGLLVGLVSVGYLVQDGGRYRLGTQLVDLALKARPDSFVQACRPELQRLALETGETVTLGARVGDGVVYIDQVESQQSIRYSAPLYERRSLLHTSTGKLFLAQLGSNQLEDVFTRIGEGEMAGRTRKDLRAELDEVRRSGVAYNMEETVVGVVGVAAGIWVEGGLVGCISVAGPSARIRAALPSLAEAVQAAALRASGSLWGMGNISASKLG
jgi:DNA-binding IclR family transcriptional regulator